MKNLIGATIIIIILYHMFNEATKGISEALKDFTFLGATTYWILAGTGGLGAVIWRVIYQSSSRRKRDNELNRLLKEEPGKINHAEQLKDEFTEEKKTDQLIKKGNRWFMTGDNSKSNQ